MKKIVALICLLAMTLPLCACASGSIAPAEEAKTDAEEKKPQAVTKAEEKGEIVYPDTFAIGYGRADISGPLPVAIWEDEAETVLDPLYLTCIAVWDGEKAALLMTADAMGVSWTVYEQCAKRVQKAYNVSPENIIINVTHSHSAPSIGSDARWLKNFYQQFNVVVEEALRDLAPATAFVGKGYTEDLNFVRRYQLADGSWDTNSSASDNPIAHESEADNELRTVRFEREGKKDVLMVNWQAHYMSGVPEHKLSADIFGEFRKSAEAEFDCHYAYFSGSSGNLNFFSAIPGERKYWNWKDGAAEFTRATTEALKTEEPAQVGKISSQMSTYTATVKKDSPERVALAKKIASTTDATLKSQMVREYGFLSKYEASAVVTRSEMGDTKDIHFFAITFGDIAISTAPFEQFDTNGQEVRAASPFKQTFTLSMTNESNNYVPSELAEEHMSYEVSTCRFEKGSGSAFRNEQIRLLNECKAAS